MVRYSLQTFPHFPNSHLTFLGSALKIRSKGEPLLMCTDFHRLPNRGRAVTLDRFSFDKWCEWWHTWLKWICSEFYMNHIVFETLCAPAGSLSWTFLRFSELWSHFWDHWLRKTGWPSVLCTLDMVVCLKESNHTHEVLSYNSQLWQSNLSSEATYSAMTKWSYMTWQVVSEYRDACEHYVAMVRFLGAQNSQ